MYITKFIKIIHSLQDLKEMNYTQKEREAIYYERFSEVMYLFMEYEDNIPLFYKKYLRELSSKEKELVFEYLEKYGDAQSLFLFKKWAERSEPLPDKRKSINVTNCFVSNEMPYSNEPETQEHLFNENF